MNTKTTTFFCSRQTRGAAPCDKQCSQCATELQRAEAARATTAPPKPAPVAEATAAQEQAGPRVQARLSITLFEDGNVQVDGPFTDRVLFAGLLYLGAEMERTMFANRQREAARRALEVAAVQAQVAKGKGGFREKARRLLGRGKPN